jgi:hypothetical protein
MSADPLIDECAKCVKREVYGFTDTVAFHALSQEE